jgi:hypothetical protein
MNKAALVALASLALGACATPTQTVGTAGGAVARAAVGGPVGAVVGGAVGAVATAPALLEGSYRYRCFWRDRYGLAVGAGPRTTAPSLDRELRRA